MRLTLEFSHERRRYKSNNGKTRKLLHTGIMPRRYKGKEWTKEEETKK